MGNLERAAETSVRVRTGTACLTIRVGADGRVAAARPATADAGAEVTTLGLVDLQVNGFAGIDFNRDDLTADDVDVALAALLATGTTRLLPTVITSAPETMAARLRSLDRAVGDSRLGPWMVAGYHLEGPFLSPEDGYAGCHPKQHMRAADWAFVEGLGRGLARPIRLLTVAPEQDGAVGLIPKATARGIVVAIGHTNASRDRIGAAVDAGARLSTHLGNGIGHALSKNENPLFAQLGEDRLFASFIADGVHIPPHMLRIYVRAKQLARSILVTDATAGAAAAPGLYTLGDVAIEKHADGSVREPGSPYLGGSSATAEALARNVMAWLDLEWDDVLALMRINPLAVLGEPAAPAAGDAAELVRWEAGADGPRVAEARVGPWRITRGDR